MFSILKITTKREMSNDPFYHCEDRVSASQWKQMMIFTTADCKTGFTANADVRKQVVNQHLLPFCGTFPGVPAREHTAATGHTLALPAEKGDISLCCLLLNTRLSQRNYSGDDQHTVFTVEYFDQQLSERQKRQETTDKPPQWPRQMDGKL